MASGAIVPDVSSWNAGLTKNFAGDFLIFRANDGLYQDPKFLSNAVLANVLYQEGHFAGAACYSVYRPLPVKQQYDFFWQLIGPKIPDWLKAHMTDVESWGGKLRGDQSASLNTLIGMHAHQFGMWSSVLAYGNMFDLATLYARRDPRVRVVVAAYTSQLLYKKVPGAIGQQYTDGTLNNPIPAGLRRATAEFGNVDHNVFPDFANGKALANYLRPNKVIVPPPAPKPTPTPAKPPAHGPAKPFYPKGVSTLTAGSRQYEVLLGDNGHLRLYYRGAEVGEFQLVRSGPSTPVVAPK